MQQNGWDLPPSLLPEVAPLRQASRRLVRELGVLDNRVIGRGLPYSQCHALIEIDRRGVMTAGELAVALNLDKSTTSRAVAGLIRAGLVGTRADGDRRKRPLVLTGKGRRRLAAIHGRANHQVQEALDLLDAEERSAVVRGMELYARALARRRAQQLFAIRPVTRRDDPLLGKIIRSALGEYGAIGPGYASHDPEIDQMSEMYAGPGHGYWVVARDGEAMGGGGFGPLQGGEPTVCELRKMYLCREARGTGMGARLLALVLEEARQSGYRACYLETLVAMTEARKLYESFGFRRLDHPLGATGHFQTDAWYVRDLDPISVSAR